MLQDDVNVPGCPIALGFTMEKLSAHTIDEAGKEVFVHKNALDLLRKVSAGGTVLARFRKPELVH